MDRCRQHPLISHGILISCRSPKTCSHLLITAGRAQPTLIVWAIDGHRRGRVQASPASIFLPAASSYGFRSRRWSCHCSRPHRRSAAGDGYEERRSAAANINLLRSAAIRRRRFSSANGSLEEESADMPDETAAGTAGTVLGAVSLIIGTSIGSGILALPQKTSHAGFIPSAASMTICWALLLIEALLLAEVNVRLREKRINNEGRVGVNGKAMDHVIISFRTMAEETLGEWGASAATITYVFRAYTSMMAYAAKSGDLLSSLVGLPPSASGVLFTVAHAALIVMGGTNMTDRVNQWLTASMLGLLAAIELMAFRGWSGSAMAANWGEVPSTIPVIIFSLVYHDITPVLCSYLRGDLARIRSSVVVGSIIPLVSLLVWDAIVLGLSPGPDGTDPLNLFMRGTCNEIWLMVEAFSLLAVGTSLIGTLLSSSQFFQEQLCNFLRSSPSTQEKIERDSRGLRANWIEHLGLQKWLVSNDNFVAMAMAVIPTLLVSTTIPDAFSVATDIALLVTDHILVKKGGYCITMLYGILPPAMAWAMHAGTNDVDGDTGGNS